MVIHVAVGVIVDDLDRILISRRLQHLHQGGLWEFPGGKLEIGETVESALKRELYEELGIEVIKSNPLLKIEHDYSDKKVLLDVWQVTKFSGKAEGKEGQDCVWVRRGELSNYQFPAANKAILESLCPVTTLERDPR